MMTGSLRFDKMRSKVVPMASIDCILETDWRGRADLRRSIWVLVGNIRKGKVKNR